MKYEISTFLENLSQFSAPGPGVTRRSFTKESQDAWEYIILTMESLGLKVRTDNLGTIVGHLEGKRKESIMLGSHYDSVIQGGKYDGAVGIAVGLAVAAYFAEKGIRPDYSLDILATNDEEGGTIGDGFLSSKHICGLLQEEKCKNEATGKSLNEYISEGWYTKSGRGRDDLRLNTAFQNVIQYIETHIEQGGILWENQEQIGVVKHIVGLTKLFVTIRGISNHAGTTPMDLRKDAMVAAAKVISKIPELACAYEGAVATVGAIYCSPNADNVIPGEVRFAVDIRSACDEDRRKLVDAITSLIQQQSPVSCEIVQSLNQVAVAMDPKLVSTMEQICRDAHYRYRIMNSGAGHDAQVFGLYLDTVMLFIPSQDGISHSPQEFSRIEDMERAAQVLIDYTLSLG